MINGPVWDESKLQEEGENPTVLAIGDSWFKYPMNNLANHLHKILNRNRKHVMLVRGANGAEAIEYESGPIRSQIEWDLKKRGGYGRFIEAVFLSGGGNDLAGKDDFAKVILDDCSGARTPEECLRRGQPTRLFNTVQKALLSVVDLVQKNIPGTPVFVHGYDYANPNGVGFLGLGQWLQYPMLQCGVPLKLHQPLVNLIIDEFWNSLQRSQAQAPTLHLVDERGTLKREDWANELHPTLPGFNQVAKCWTPVLKAQGLLASKDRP